jgi:endogenous inhibitor of DNA gyrase (YacG/DUF329 family)
MGGDPERQAARERISPAREPPQVCGLSASTKMGRMITRQCPVCGTEIDATPRRGRPRVYCSARHRSLAWYRDHRAAQPARPWTAQERAEAAEQFREWVASLPDDPFAGLA